MIEASGPVDRRAFGHYRPDELVLGLAGELGIGELEADWVVRMFIRVLRRNLKALGACRLGGAGRFVLVDCPSNYNGFLLHFWASRWMVKSIGDDFRRSRAELPTVKANPSRRLEERESERKEDPVREAREEVVRAAMEFAAAGDDGRDWASAEDRLLEAARGLRLAMGAPAPVEVAEVSTDAA